jgi:hypothetical protein
MKRRHRPPITESSQSLTFTRRALVLGAAQAAAGSSIATATQWRPTAATSGST